MVKQKIVQKVLYWCSAQVMFYLVTWQIQTNVLETNRQMRTTTNFPFCCFSSYTGVTTAASSLLVASYLVENDGTPVMNEATKYIMSVHENG